MVQRRKRSKRWIFWLFFLVLLIAAGYVCYSVWDNYFNDQKEDESSEEEKKEEQKEKVEINDADEDEDEVVVQKEEVVQYDGEDPNGLDKITGVITYAGVVDSALIIRINIDQYLSSGNCALKLIEDGIEIYNDSVGLDSSASTTTCMGFDVPVPAIGGGNFEIVVDVDAGERNGTITGEVSI